MPVDEDEGKESNEKESGENKQDMTKVCTIMPSVCDTNT